MSADTDNDRFNFYALFLGSNLYLVINIDRYLTQKV